MIPLPGGNWTDVFTGVTHTGGRLEMHDLLSQLPIALLRSA
jgi:maltooligosyltrehalose synthase